MGKKSVWLSLLCGLLAAVLLAGPAAANHDDSDIPYAVTGGNIWFDQLSGSIMDCDINVKRAVIPPQINGVTVTAIGNYAFMGSSVERVDFPDTITRIRPHAFWNCNGLTTVLLPDSVEYIGHDAFGSCYGLRRIVLPGSLKAIEENTFNTCEALLSVTIPVSITEIKPGAFYQCGELEDVYYAGTQDQWNAVTIADGNEELLSAKLHTESGGPELPDSAPLSVTLSTPSFGTDIPLTVTGSGTRTVRFITAFYDENRRFLGLESTLNTLYPGLQSVFVPVSQWAFVPAMKAFTVDEKFCPLAPSESAESSGGALDDRYAAILSEPDADRRTALTDALSEQEAKAFIKQFAGWFH